ncbi:MAG: hypothetical protein A2201_12950 [Alicyclobacillus sp. RIFOXYA1_FULL_53_8]|nr:MAG: hypothetical protein A2201_12950 [Alicyclobacillus sp. RIFOXYA1_FULL_53_8]
MTEEDKGAEFELWDRPDGMQESNYAPPSPYIGRRNSGRRRFWPVYEVLRRRPIRSLSLLAGLAVLGLGTWVITRTLAPPASERSQPTPQSSPQTVLSQPGEGQKIVVDVHGDVLHPGVYTLATDARVSDAIKAAGGLLHPQDAQFVNSAAPLDDGQEVLIPAPDVASPNSVAPSSLAPGATPTAPAGAADSPSTSSTTARIDINTATQATLETLPGIGPSRAAAMIQYRQQHGGFKSADELQNIPGIGPKTWAKLAPYVYIQSSHGQKP